MTSLKDTATQIRRDILRMVYDCQSGHPGGSLGCADFFTALYFKVMRHRPDFHMDGKNEDVFILSNGHISPVYYSALARSGYFPIEEMRTFRQLNSRLQGHPATAEHLPGIRIATGSLGQGMSVAIGAALAKKLNGDDHLVFSLHGDGELEEGQIWEAALSAAHHKVDNLISTIDRNGAQIDGPTEEVGGLGDVGAKFEAFGWKVLDLPEGNDIERIAATLEEAKSLTGHGRPIAIIMHTLMGKGVDYMEDDFHWHGIAPNKEQLEQAMAQLPETIGDY
jgi:transketolase